MVRWLVLAPLAFALAGCWFLNAATSPLATQNPTPAEASPSTSLSAAPTHAVSSTGAPSSDPGRHGDLELEALLPNSLHGVHLTRESQLGIELTRQSDAFDAFLASLGKTPADFSLASAYSATGDVKAQLGAWRVRGADPARLLPGFIEAIQTSSTTELTITAQSIAGVPVTQIGAAGQLTQGPLYAYTQTDIVLFVQTVDPLLAAEALGEMR